MRKTGLHWRAYALATLAAAALLGGCADGGLVGPDRWTAPDSRSEARAPNLGACGNLQAPAGSKLASHTYADGVQIYRWNGTSWDFVAPSARLSADAAGKSTVGTHYAGPTWESNSGSTVVGAVSDRCIADANAIPWLLLNVTSSQGPGIYRGTIAIQRVNTVGGKAPSTPGSVIGEVTNVPYTAEYYFYR